MTSCIKLITQVASKTVQTCFLVVPLWSPTEIIQKSNTRMSFFNGPWSRLKDNMKVRDETNNRLSLERWILFKKKHANEKQEKRKFLNNAFTPRWRESVVCLILSNSFIWSRRPRKQGLHTTQHTYHQSQKDTESYAFGITPGISISLHTVSTHSGTWCCHLICSSVHGYPVILTKTGTG